MTNLGRNHVPIFRFPTETVSVAEFGSDDSGEPWVVLVRAMTVADRAFLGNLMSNAGQAAGSHSATAIVAALSAVDERGELVFGTNRMEAVLNCEKFPAGIAAALERIAEVALRLSRAGAENDSEAVMQAKKN